MTVQTKIEEICHQYTCQRRWGKDHEASPILHKAQQATKKFYSKESSLLQGRAQQTLIQNQMVSLENIGAGSII